MRGRFALLLVLLSSPAAAADNAKDVPDFTGPWGRNMFNFETPDTGPGPIVNLSRLGSYAGRSVVDGDPIPLVGDYRNPILKPDAAAAVQRSGEFSNSGHDIPDPSNQCGAYAPPFLFQMQQGMVMLQRKSDIVILYTQNAQVRHVRLNASHRSDQKPTAMGDSVAHYDGDTLVIDTVGIELQPYTVVDRYGTPQSAAMHVIERYRLIDASEAQAAMDRHAKVDGTTGPIVVDPKYGKGLRLELRIEDPNIFTTPWNANISFRRVIRGFNEGACAENNVDHFQLGDFGHIPRDDTPDF